MSTELTEHRLSALEEDRRAAASWREQTSAAIGRIESSVCQGFALGTRRMDEIDRHLAATDRHVEELQASNRRDPVSFWSAIAAVITAMAAAVLSIFHK